MSLGRVAIGGAGGGLGAACARAFAARGAHVVAIGRRPEPLEAVAVDVARAGGRVTTLVADLGDPAAVAAAFARIERLDAYVNCVGGNRPQPFLDVTADDLDWAWRANVRAAFLPAQAAARRLVAAGGGTIVHVTSQMGHVGAPLRTAYCAVKHAVEGLTKAMAVELAPHAVRVNAVAPTFVETPMTRGWLADPDERRSVLERIPLGRLATGAEVAAAVVFAASPASGAMTGASLRIDGGWTAQ